MDTQEFRAKLVDSQSSKVFPTYIQESIPINGTFDIDHDFILRKHKKLDIWEVKTSYKKETQGYQPSDRDRLVSFDPGVRTFLTRVNDQGNVIEYGKGWSSCLQKRIKQANGIPLVGLKGRARFNAWKSNKQTKLHHQKLHNQIKVK